MKNRINKNLILVFLTVMGTFSAAAQYESTLKLMEKGKIEAAHKKVYDSYIKNPEDIELNYSLATLYACKDYQNKDFRLAYEYAKRTEDFYMRFVEENPRDKKIRKWQQIGITLPVIKSFKKNIALQAIQEAVKTSNRVLLKQYIEVFDDDEEFKNEAIHLLEELSFEIVKKANTIEGYQEFIADFPEAVQVGEARYSIESQFFERAQKENTISSWTTFLEGYPDSQYRNRVLVEIDKLSFQKAKEDGTVEGLKQYITDFPQGIYIEVASATYEKQNYERYANTHRVEDMMEFIANNEESAYLDQSIDQLLSLSKQTNNLTGGMFFVEHFPHHPRRTEILYWLYGSCTSDGELKSILQFEERFPYFVDPLTISQDKALYQKAISLKLDQPFHERNYASYRKLLPDLLPKDLGFVALQRAMSEFIRTKQYRKAEERLQAYTSYFPRHDRRVLDLERMLQAEEDPHITPLPVETINLFANNQVVSPLLSADGKTLFFSAKKTTSFDIYVSYLKVGKWTPPIMLEPISTSDADEFPFDISTDGSRLLFGRNGDLFIATGKDTLWVEKEELPSNINTPAIETEAVFLPDETGIMFVSDRVNGKNGNQSGEFYHGDHALAGDIYIALKTDEGWADPIGLHYPINTRYSERSPSFSPDGKMLFFSSDGHGGLGRHDIFVSYRLKEDSWLDWSIPSPMGKEINTPFSEMSFRLSNDMRLSCFTRVESWKEKKLFLLPNISHALKQQELVVGNVTDEEGNLVESVVRFFDAETGEKEEQCFFDPILGVFVGAVNKHHAYYVQSINGDGFSLMQRVDSASRKASDSIKIVSHNIEDLAKKKKSLVISKMFTSEEQTTLSWKGKEQLKAIAGILQGNALTLTVAVNTKSMKTAREAYDLSNKQAQIIKKFLLQQGLEDARVSASGYGDLKPLLGNKKTHRIEFLFSY